MGCLMYIIGFALCFFGFVFTIMGFHLAVIMMLVGGLVLGMASAMSEHIPVNKLFAQGDIVGKDLAYILKVL